MELMLDPQFYVAQLEGARSWLAANALLLNVSTTGQMIIVVGALLGARSITPRARSLLNASRRGVGTKRSCGALPLPSHRWRCRLRGSFSCGCQC